MLAGLIAEIISSGILYSLITVHSSFLSCNQACVARSFSFVIKAETS